MTFRAEIRAGLGWNWVAGPVDNNRLDYAGQLAEGHGNGEAEAVWHLEGETLLAGGSANLDLTALVRAALGDVLTTCLLSVKALMILNDADSAGTLVVGGAGGDEWSAPFGADGDALQVAPDGAVLLANRQAGWPVDDANKLLKLSASGGDVTYSIALAGTLTAEGSGSSGE